MSGGYDNPKGSWWLLGTNEEPMGGLKAPALFCVFMAVHLRCFDLIKYQLHKTGNDNMLSYINLCEKVLQHLLAAKMFGNAFSLGSRECAMYM